MHNTIGVPVMLNPDEFSHIAVGSVELEGVATILTQLAKRLTGVPDEELPQAVVDVALEMIPAARWSSLTMLRHGRFTSLCASDHLARRIDAVQYQIGSGPCVDSILHGTTHMVGDLTKDPRWPGFTDRVTPEGVRSVYAHRLRMAGDSQTMAALNVYSDRIDAFDDQTRWAGAMLATHGALAVSLALSHQEVLDLERAVGTNRDIGTAVGLLMEQHDITREQSLNLLRLVSQDTNRKLADVANEMIRTGRLGL